MFKLGAIFALYVLISAYLFPLVYEASPEVIDEQFHLRQGLHYCEGDFSVWDPKITTFPGLYIASTILNYPLGTCSAWSLRLTSLLASCANFWLIYHIRRTVLAQSNGASHKPGGHIAHAASPWIGLEAFSIAMLPPLYFFSHLYYTDVLSMSTVLAMILFNLRNQHHLAALSGLLSVGMRQTNIVWVAMALGTTVCDKLVLQTLPFIKQNERYGRPDHVYGFGDIAAVLLFYVRRFYLIPKQIRLLVTHLCGYGVVLLAFGGFVVWNGSIVVGDKEAHEAAAHWPQLGYFALFALVFGVAIWLPSVRQVLADLKSGWLVAAIGGALFALAVAFNTVEHPYLLADNRHYTFYVWNRFFGAWEAARYLAVPVYVFGLAAINRTLADSRTAGFRMGLTVATVLVLCFQRMIEVRYFLVPFVLVRLHAAAVNRWWLAVELVWYAALNAATFYVFSTKEIRWEDFEAVQRLIW